jgi:hypothetical protein
MSSTTRPEEGLFAQADSECLRRKLTQLFRSHPANVAPGIYR